MPHRMKDRSRYLAIVVCDADNASHAESLATQIGLPLWQLGCPSDLVLAEVSQAIIDINMRNAASVSALRDLLKQLPAALPRRFIVESGTATYASRVQANSLGATHLVVRHKAVLELRAVLSGMSDLGVPLPEQKRQAIARAAGGKSVLSAGGSLTTLFESLVGDQVLPVETISMASAEVVADVAAIGGEKWLDTVRQHHENTFQHCLLVTGVAANYATTNHLSRAAATTLVNAALVHDVGKAMIPQQILDKPGRLTESEFAVIKRHPRAGYDYLKGHANLPEVVLDAVLHHHEALDGSGYPDGLVGAQILPMTRILTVCDIFAAMVERRSYKEPETPSAAIMHIVDMALRSRVDYSVVRRLGAGFNFPLPETLEDLAAGLDQRDHARA